MYVLCGLAPIHPVTFAKLPAASALSGPQLIGSLRGRIQVLNFSFSTPIVHQPYLPLRVGVMAESYIYQSLSGPQCIRVLELAPANEETNRLEGNLVEVNLALGQKQRSSYEALSYVWGSPEDQGAIFCKARRYPYPKTASRLYASLDTGRRYAAFG